jgi:phage terminase small subunit
MLTEKQRLFVEEYLANDLNATKAYKNVYKAVKKDETAAVNASRLLRNANVQAYLKARQARLQKRLEITQERVLQELARISFFDPRNLFNDDGTPKEISDLDDDTAAALSGLDLQDVYEGYGEERKFIGYTKKYKVADKKGALDSLARHLGMFTDNMNIKGAVDINNPLKGIETSDIKELIQALKK